jgi:O-antigen/teichoic acid export membrane protein
MTSLKKNFAYNIAYQILVIALPLITAPYISRVLGVDGVGTYSYGYSIAYYFGLCGMLGISNHGNRSIALIKNDPGKISQVFSNIYCIQFCTTAVAISAYLLFVTFLFQGNKVVAYIDILFVVSSLLDINWFFFGMEKFKLTVTRNTILKLVTVACIFIFVKNKDDLWKYTAIMALGTAGSQVYLWTCIKKYVIFSKPIWNDVKKQIKPIIVLFIPVIAYSIYKVMDKIMIGSMTTVAQVGLYENAEKIVGIPVGVITAFGTVMMPRISALTAAKDKGKISDYNKISFRYFTLLVVGMTFGLSGVSRVFPTVFFGTEFSDCDVLIAGLSFTLIFMTWANIIRTQYLIPIKNDKPYVVSTVIGAIINLVFNMTFIPLLQAKGALIGTLLAEFSVFFVQMLYVRKEFPVMKYLKSCIAFFPMGIIMGVIVDWTGKELKISGRTLVLQITIGSVLYLLMAFGYLWAIHDETLTKMINKIVSARKRSQNG